MAVYPCSVDAHRYKGAQRSAYISVVKGRDPETRKLRLCPRHMGDLQAAARDLLSLVEDEAQMSMICEGSECAKTRAMSVFVKIFLENHDEPDEYAGDFCASCGQSALELLDWGSGSSMNPHV